MNVTKYRKYRGQGVPAHVAAVWARTPELSEQWPGVTWEGGWYATEYTLPNGYTVTIDLEQDCDAEPDGKYTDAWQPGAIQHTEWRPGNHSRVYRWYLPLNTVDDHRLSLSRMGYARHEAYTLAVRYAREECQRNIEVFHYGIRVTVSDPGGATVGHASLYGIDPGDDADGNDYLQDMARELIREAMPEDAPGWNDVAA